MSKLNLIFSFLLIILISSCDDGTVDINDAEAFDTYLEEEMTRQNIPALSVLIFEGETIKYEKTLGHSDIENDVSLTQNDLFLMASVSKMVTGTALLKLYENGEFDLDDKINDYLPFNVDVPNQSTPITFKMLLTHTSAIKDGPNSGIFYSYGQDSPLALKEYLEKYLTPNGAYYDASKNFYNYEPGTNYNYSNMASALIGVLVAEISNKDFKVYCQDNIFQPLGMSNTYWSLNAALQSNKTLVNPYEYSGGEFDSIQHYTFPDYPNGGLRSTARDMMKFLNALAQDGGSILSSNTVSEMLTQYVSKGNDILGLHIFLMDEDANIWGHNGLEQGVSTEVGFNPSNDVGVVVLSSLRDVGVGEILQQAYQLGLKL